MNSVKKHNYKIWLNDGVLVARKNYMFRPSSDSVNILPKEFYIICLGILYKTLLAENCQNLKMAAIGRNM